MEIAVLGIDLGKTVCSVAGLKAERATYRPFGEPTEALLTRGQTMTTSVPQL